MDERRLMIEALCHVLLFFFLIAVLRNNMYCGGLHTVASLQHSLQGYNDVMLFCSHIGDPRYCFLILFPVAYCLSISLGLKVLWTSALIEWLNAVLKWMFRDDRPYWWQSPSCPLQGDSIKQFSITCESGPGFPSGHVMSSSAVGLLLILHTQTVMRNGRLKIIFSVLAIPVYFAVVFLVSVSRLYIGTHFPHQVVGGALVGSVVAVLINSLFQVYTIDIMFNPLAILIGLGSLFTSFVLYYILMAMELNPQATVTYALAHCASREWVHLDTTLFFAVIRDAGCLTGLGLASMMIKWLVGYRGTIELLTGKLCPLFRLACILSVCPSLLFMESFRTPQENVLTFYAVAFLKFAMLPVYVITIRCCFEILNELFTSNKCKVK